MARKYPIIGGDLNGDLANERDFRPERRAMRSIGRFTLYGDVLSPGGQFGAWADQYVAYNRADARAKAPTRVWLHKSMVT